MAVAKSSPPAAVRARATAGLLRKTRVVVAASARAFLRDHAPTHSAALAEGLGRFRRLLSTAAGKPVDQVRKSIELIAESSKSCVPVETQRKVCVELFPDLATRQQTAEWVDSLLSESGVTGAPGSGLEGMFSWLAMVALPSLCRRNKAGRLAIKDLERYAQTSETSGFYRHLVSGPYWFQRQHGQHARIFLCQAAYVMPEVQEQVVSRPWFRESKAAIELIDRLYWDADAGAPKRDYTATDRVDDPPPGTAKTQPKPGTLRALEAFLSQLQCTHDLQTMTVDQLLPLLPPQFRTWLSRAGQTGPPPVRASGTTW